MKGNNNMQSITVHKDNKPIYNMNFNNDYSSLKDFLASSDLHNRKVCVVSDSNVSKFWLDNIIEELNSLQISKCISVVLPAGEENKNTDNIFNIIEQLIANRFDRKDCLIALGGGVIGDMTGFAASIYLRGIKFFQIPTSLLAMVDSSIGGKTGVDFNGYKNMVGAFHMPSGVLINTQALTTLPDREYISGFAEIIKHAIIADNAYFDYLFQNAAKALAKDMDITGNIIYKSCRIKQHVVETDPTEKGIRAFLNFGHTIGHAIEKYMNFSLLHGECVSLGIVASSYISYKRNMISGDNYESIRALLKAYSLPVCFNDIKDRAGDNVITESDIDDIINITKSDKKADGAVIKFVLADSIGNAVIDTTVSDAEQRNALEELLKG